MRDLKEDGARHDRLVAEAAERVAVQARRVQAIAPNDPNLAGQRLVLRRLQLTSSMVTMARAVACWDDVQL